MPNDDLPPPKADFSAPPPYELTDQHPQLNSSSNRPFHQPQTVQLPPLNTTNNEQPHCKLPTYEEVQREKILNDELPIPQLLNPTPPPPIHHSMRAPQPTQNLGGPTMTFIAIDTDGEQIAGENNLLGTDLMFITAFFVAFIFNWIGFLMLTCFCHTIAARYGALSGFGLSLAKWTLIVKHSTEYASHDNSWLWWLIMTFGFLICIRALVQYINIKKTWGLLSNNAQERLLFFY
jgi:hypothetical protein